MSFMNLRMIPGEAMLEDVESMPLPTTPEEVKAPEDVAAIQQYQEDPTTPYRKVINKILPMNDNIEHILREIPLEPDDKISAANDLNFIKDTATCIAECMPMLIYKLSACADIFRSDMYMYQSLISNAKVFITKADKIKRLGLANYKCVRHDTFPILSNLGSIEAITKLFGVCQPGDDYVLSMQSLKAAYDTYSTNDFDYFESMGDLIGVVCHPESDRFNRLCSTSESTCDILSRFTSIDHINRHSSIYQDSMRTSMIDAVACNCAKMLRFVSTNVYDLMIAIDDNETDNKYYRETLKKVVSTVSNSFYMCSMLALALSLYIEQRVNDKRDLDAHVAKIIAEVKHNA